MRRPETFWTALAVAIAIVLLPAEGAAQSGRGGRREIDTTFFFRKLGTVVVGNGAATVIVGSWDQTSIRVKAKDDDGALRFEATATRVVVETTQLQDNAVIQPATSRSRTPGATWTWRRAPARSPSSAHATSRR
jgi:hypothetical protein